VIIDAIKESREIFVRMNSYAMYRIAETLRVLVFMTLAIVVFNFFPVTAIMIVMLAVLNDGAILSIAYDNVRARDEPEAWDMRMVLTIATVLGIVGPIAAFGLFYFGEEVLRIDHPQLQTMMYLLLSVAGHLTIFQTRTRGAWWTVRPARILILAVVGTQVLATGICVAGFLVTPLWWGWAALVWGYALIWFLVTDPIKLLAYRYLDATKKAAPRRQDEPAAAPAKAEDAKVGPAKTDPAKAVPTKAPDAKAVPSKVEGAAAAPAKAEEAEPDDAKAFSPPAPHPTPAIARPAGEETHIHAESLLDMKLGDLLTAGIVKDPEDAGRLIAAGLAETKSRAATAKAEAPRPAPTDGSAPGKAPVPPGDAPQRAAE
jgi:H+-transporting ATPase